MLVGDGTAIEDGVVLVQDGVIHAVGADVEVPTGAAVVDCDGTLAPGMVALTSREGASGELIDPTRQLLPGADMVYAFAPDSADFARTLGCGITTVVLAPLPNALVSGTSAVVKTSGGQVVEERAQLAVSLSSSALRSNEFPTSYSGALSALDEAFQEPEGSIARAVGGSLPVLMDGGERDEIQRSLRFAKEHGLRGALRGSRWAEDVVDLIRSSGFDVVCDPFDVGQDERSMRSVVALSKAGVRLGFGLDAPDRSPESLRFGAALCVRDGLSREAAMKALTSDAAAIAGVGGRVGRIARGLDADLVVWSGDPLDLGSSIEAIYVNGARVDGGEER